MGEYRTVSRNVMNLSHEFVPTQSIFDVRTDGIYFYD